MSRLMDLMTTRGLPALQRELGDDAVYTPPYIAPAEPAPVTTWAIVRASSAMIGQYGETFEPRQTAMLPKSDVALPKIGATLVVSTVTYRIDQIIDHDNLFHTVALSVA